MGRARKIKDEKIKTKIIDLILQKKTNIEIAEILKQEDNIEVTPATIGNYRRNELEYDENYKKQVQIKKEKEKEQIKNIIDFEELKRESTAKFIERIRKYQEGLTDIINSIINPLNLEEEMIRFVKEIISDSSNVELKVKNFIERIKYSFPYFQKQNFCQLLKAFLKYDKYENDYIRKNREFMN